MSRVDMKLCFQFFVKYDSRDYRDDHDDRLHEIDRKNLGVDEMQNNTFRKT